MKPLPLAEAEAEGDFGGKAVQLGAALRAGLPVPGGFALPAHFVAAVADGDTAACAVLAEIEAELRGNLAVRSSAIGEDSATSSFAGQHATLLNVRGAAGLTAAVTEIWLSGFSESALAYRRKAGIDAEVRMGVVIQKLVAADAAGVMFTRNPMNGSDELVIEASWGLGEAVVQGLVVPDMFRIARDGAVLQRQAGWKTERVVMLDSGLTAREPVPGHLVEHPCLDDTELAALHGLAIHCDLAFGGGPHDIEWAFVGRRQRKWRADARAYISINRCGQS
jgi:pyruvate, water dikinase